MRKVFWWGLGLGLSLALLVIWQWPDGKLQVIACDVGQGDAWLIVHGFDQVLIDGGPTRGGVGDCLGRHLPFWDRRLEMVVATHPDADHVGGLAEIIRDYQVGFVLRPEASKDTGTYAAFAQELVNERVKTHLAEAGQELHLGQLRWKVLWPPRGHDSRDSNEVSIVLVLQYHDFRAWFTGDAPMKVERALLERGAVMPVTYLKVSHHGSAGATSVDFLEKLRPAIAAMGVGAHNRYGHPDASVLQRLKTAGVRAWRTDTDGEGIVVSDGSRWWESKKRFSQQLW